MSDSSNDVKNRIQNAAGSLNEQIRRMDISEDAKQSILDNFNWLLAKSRENPDGETADFLNDQISGLLDLVDSISSGDDEVDSEKEEQLKQDKRQDERQNGTRDRTRKKQDKKHEVNQDQGQAPPPDGDGQQKQQGTSRGKDWMDSGKLTEQDQDQGQGQRKDDGQDQRQTPPANGDGQQKQQGTSRGKDWMDSGKLTEQDQGQGQGQGQGQRKDDGQDQRQTPPANGDGQRKQPGASRGKDWMDSGKLTEQDQDQGQRKDDRQHQGQRKDDGQDYGQRKDDGQDQGQSTQLTKPTGGQEEEPRRLNAKDWMRSAAYPWQDPNHPDPDDVHTQPVHKYTPDRDRDRRRRRSDPPHHNYGRDQLLRLMPDDKPDVVLNVPNVSVDLIDFEINNLSARVAVDLAVANDAVKLFVGVDVHLERVKLTIENVQACAQLIVRLDTVRQIVDRALEAIDSDKHNSVLGITQGLLKR